MVSQLRIYTINNGKMDEWLKVFEEQLRPIHTKYGIPVERTWVNDERTEFIWVRNFDSVEDMEKKTTTYVTSPERKALGAMPGSLIAKTEVRVIEPVLTG